MELDERSPCRRAASLVARAGGVVLLLGTIWFLGMRTKWRPVIDLQRSINRRFVNPRQMQSAGTPGAYAGVIHHVGRRSRMSYATPVVPIPIDGGFAVLLPYGERSDWVRNVLAEGSATIDHEGATYEVVDPQVRPVAEVELGLGPSDERARRAFRHETCLTVHLVTDAPAPVA